MAITTNGTVITRLANALYGEYLSNASYNEVKDTAAATVAANFLTNDFAGKTDLQIATKILTNLGLTEITGLDNWVAAQLTAAGETVAAKGAVLVSLLNGYAAMSEDETYGEYATAFNTKVATAQALSQTTGNTGGKFADIGAVVDQAFVLTAGLDNFVGGAGDDSFEATAVNPKTGADQTDINSGDAVDGGAGDDTLSLTLTAANNSSLSGLTVKNVENIQISGVNSLASGAAEAEAAAEDLSDAQDAYDTGAAASIIADQKAAAAAAVATLLSGDAADDQVVLDDIAELDEDTYNADNAEDYFSDDYTLGQLQAAATAVTKASNGTSLLNDDGEIENDDAAAVIDERADAISEAKEAIAVAKAADLADLEDDLDIATTANEIAQDALGVATVSAAQFVGATSLTVDGVTTKVTGVKDGLTVAFNGGTIANTITFAAGTTAATVDVTGSKGTITLDDASTTTATTTLKTLTINGSIKSTAGTNAAHTSAAAGTITIAESLGTSDAETITTVNLGVTSSGTVDLTDMSKLTTVNASASTGALTITTSAAGNARLANVTGGAGADRITVDFETNANGTSSAPKAASVDGGAGNDTITITDDVGTGKVSVDAGSGDDTVATSTDALQGDLKIDGGTGTDKIKLTAETEATDNGDELSATDFIVLEESVSNFERAEFVNVTYLDASDVSQFTTIDAGDDTETIVNIASTQKINTKITSSFTAEGYIALGTEEADDAGLTATKYAGTLAVTATSDPTVTLNASSATLNVNNVSSVASQHVGDQTASEVTVDGNLKSLTVAFAATAGKDYVVAPTTEVISSVSITIDSAEEDADGNLTNLGNLASITLTGVGSATIDNSNNDDVSKLVTVDASGLGGTWTLPTANAGDPLGGLTYTANIATAETIKLGAGQDVITLASTYSKTDTITGFKLVAQADGTLDTDLSDSFDFTPESDSEWIAVTSGLTGTTLAANLRIVAAKVGASDDAKYDNVVFQWGGNTYIFSESVTESTTVDAADVLVKLTGLIDLDLLVESLSAA